MGRYEKNCLKQRSYCFCSYFMVHDWVYTQDSTGPLSPSMFFCQEFIFHQSTRHHQTNFCKNLKTFPEKLLPFHPGDTFQGAYAENRKCGHGVYTWADGTEESGEYLEGQKHGKHRWVKGKEQWEMIYEKGTLVPWPSVDWNISFLMIFVVGSSFCP